MRSANHVQGEYNDHLYYVQMTRLVGVSGTKTTVPLAKPARSPRIPKRNVKKPLAILDIVVSGTYLRAVLKEVSANLV